VKQPEDKTGAGMMDRENALSESEGDIIKAQELLRKKKRLSECRQESSQSNFRRKDRFLHP